MGTDTNGVHRTPTKSEVLDPTFPIPNTPEWGTMNQRRGELIRKRIRETLTTEEAIELQRLQEQSLAAVNATFPPSPLVEELRSLEDRLSKQMTPENE